VQVGLGKDASFDSCDLVAVKNHLYGTPVRNADCKRTHQACGSRRGDIVSPL
jgi:hypothetical protein